MQPFLLWGTYQMSVRFIVQGWQGGKKTEREEDLQARDASKSCVWAKEKE